MDNILFMYNIVLTILFTVNLTGFYFIYLKNRKKSYLFISLLYLLLVAENSIVYITEFSKSFELLYENNYLIYGFIYLVFMGIVLTIRLINSEIFADKINKREIQLFAFLQLVILLLVVVDPLEISAELIYFSFFGMLTYVFLRVYKSIINNSNTFDEKKAKRYSFFVLITALLSFIAIVECIFFYFIDTDVSSLSLITLLDYRVISFDILKIFIFVIGLKFLVSSFENMFDKKTLDDKLNEFCEEYSFTNRQKEIIKLISEGKSNKEISSMLHITEGTVKTHIYNIFRKADISSRNQIVTRIAKE